MKAASVLPRYPTGSIVTRGTTASFCLCKQRRSGIIFGKDYIIESVIEKISDDQSIFGFRAFTCMATDWLPVCTVLFDVGRLCQF